MHEFFLPIVLWGNYILFQEINSSLSLSILELSLNSFASLSIVSILVSYLCYFALFDTTFIFVAGYLLLKFPSKHDLVNCDSVSPCKSKFQHKHSFVNENVNVKRRLNDTLPDVLSHQNKADPRWIPRKELKRALPINVIMMTT